MLKFSRPESWTYCNDCRRSRSGIEFGVCPMCTSNTCGVGSCEGECCEAEHSEESSRDKGLGKVLSIEDFLQRKRRN